MLQLSPPDKDRVPPRLSQASMDRRASGFDLGRALVALAHSVFLSGCVNLKPCVRVCCFA